MPSTMPGTLYDDTTDDSENDGSSSNGLSPRTEARLAALAEADIELDTDEDDDQDYMPSFGVTAATDEDEDDVFDDDDDDDDEEDDDEGPILVDEDDEEADAGADGERPQLRIAFDPSSGQVLLVDDSGNAQRLTQSHLSGTSLSLAGIQRMILSQLGRRPAAAAEDDDEEELDPDEDDEQDEDDDGGLVDPYWGRTRRSHKSYYDIPKEPVPAGIRLERSGEFGLPPPKYAAKERRFVDYSPNLVSLFSTREITPRRMPKRWLAHDLVPNSSGVEISQLQSKVYSGQYSASGHFFVAAAQDFKIYVYDTTAPPRVGYKSVIDTPAQPVRQRMYGSSWEHRSSLKVIKTVQANAIACRWTITDASLSVDDDWMLYSSITPYVHLFKTGGGRHTGVWDLDEEQEMLDFSNGSHRSFGIWSIRFSNDGKEIVAGASSGQIFVYDIETKKSVLRVMGHQDDVNAVAFADSASSNLVISGSDDSFVKVWDRRSMSGQRASGTLVGHTEGITFVAPKGDGRYCLSNGKDQGAKLWDLRQMTSNADFDRLRLDRKDFGIRESTDPLWGSNHDSPPSIVRPTASWDYRQSYYEKPRYKEHPHDCSVMTYRGHAVLRTLIRAHFSPAATTDQQYVYSGSSDGKIHIWSLDGTLVQKIDRRFTHSLFNRETGDYNDPSDGRLRRTNGRAGGSIMVRDVSWHPYRAGELMSTAWSDGRGGVEGNLALHQWKGAAGETMVDRFERQKLEASDKELLANL